MNAHALAKLLLSGPDLPVVINGWGSCEGSTFEVNKAHKPSRASFNGEGDTRNTKRDSMGYNLPRPCISLDHCEQTPASKLELSQERARRRKMARDKKTMSSEAFCFRYATIRQLTPGELMALGNSEDELAKKT